MVFACLFANCPYRCTDAWSLANHVKFCKLNPNLARRDDSSATEDNGKKKRTANVVESGDIDDGTKDYPWNEGCAVEVHVGEHCSDDCKHEECEDEAKVDMERTVDMLAVNLCLLEKKAGKKTVEEVINAIRSEDFSKEAFVKRVRNFGDCKQICRDIVRKSLAEHMFEERTVETADRKFSSKIYVRNVQDVLKKQIEDADHTNFHIHPITNEKNGAGQSGFHHMLETEYAKRLGDVVCDRIKSDPSLDVMWMTRENSDRESFVGFMQLYSDKSKTSLKRTGVTAYPIHVNLMNFTYEGWKRQIMNETTLVAYLPVGVEYEEDIWKMSDIGNSNTSIPRVVKLELLHKAMELIMSPLSCVNHGGFHCVNREGEALVCHPIIAEIAADAPEQKDLSCLLHGCQTRKPCCRCEVVNVQMNDGNLYHPRSVIETMERRRTARQIGEQLALISGNKNSRRTQELRERRTCLLKDMSMSGYPSFLECSSLVINDEEHNMYNLFGFEPMHAFDLGISKELKKCVFRRLGSEKLVINGVERKGRTFKTSRTAILRACNEMLKRIDIQSPVPGSVVDFSSKDSSNALNGLFTSDGVCGMLEAKNYRHVDYVFPFVAAFIDRICGERDNLTTAISVLYIDLVNWVLERPCQKPWTCSEVDKLQKFVHSFQRLVVNHFGEHQPSKFCTEKFHALSHLADDIRRFGDIRMLSVGFYENRHVTFKQEYERTSRRRENTMEECVRRVESRAVLQQLGKNGSGIHCGHHEREVIEGRRRSKASLTSKRKGEVVVLTDFQKLLDYISKDMADYEDEIPKQVVEKCRRKYGDGCTNLFRKTGDQGGYALLSLLRHGNDIAENKPRTKSLYVVKSGTVIGGYSASKDCIGKGNMRIEKIFRGEPLKQRVVATEKYRGTDHDRFSFALIRGTNVDGEFTYHVVQVRALFHCDISGVTKELAFVKYMDVVKPLDGAEQILGCVCLRWSTDDDVDYSILDNSVNARKPPAQWFDIVDYDNIQSVVQVVRQRYEIGEEACRKHWATHRFCLNRFRDIGSPVADGDQDGQWVNE